MVTAPCSLNMVTARRGAGLSAEAQAFLSSQPENTNRTQAALRAILAGRPELVGPVLSGSAHPTVRDLARLIDDTPEEDGQVVFDLHGATLSEPATSYTVYICRSNTILHNGTLDMRATKVRRQPAASPPPAAR